MRKAIWLFSFFIQITFFSFAQLENNRAQHLYTQKIFPLRNTIVCKINKACFLKNYHHRADTLSNFIYLDVEFKGNGVRLDLDDLDAKIIESNGKLVDSWAFETVFLNKQGKKCASSAANNNRNYLHIGVILPASEKAKQVRLYYWGGYFGDKFVDISKTYCEIQ